MGGSIYDPTLGRFLQTDPFIQVPMNSQSYIVKREIVRQQRGKKVLILLKCYDKYRGNLYDKCVAIYTLDQIAIMCASWRT